MARRLSIFTSYLARRTIENPGELPARMKAAEQSLDTGSSGPCVARAFSFVGLQHFHGSCPCDTGPLTHRRREAHCTAEVEYARSPENPKTCRRTTRCTGPSARERHRRYLAMRSHDSRAGDGLRF